jgi:hypothetical protein
MWARGFIYSIGTVWSQGFILDVSNGRCVGNLDMTGKKITSIVLCVVPIGTIFATVAIPENPEREGQFRELEQSVGTNCSALRNPSALSVNFP